MFIIIESFQNLHQEKIKISNIILLFCNAFDPKHYIHTLL